MSVQPHVPQSPPEPALARVPFGDPLPEGDDLAAAAGRRRHLQAVPDLPLDFDAAVRSLTPRLQRYATRRLGDRHEAEELVQEALLRAYQHRAELRTEDDVAAWTTCVTGRLVIDRLRVKGRSTPVAEVPEGTRAERDTADVVVARDQARMALDALDAMPARQAAVLWAREVEGQGYDEIGRRFGMTEPAVRSLLTRARKALRKEYAVRGGTLPAAGLAVLAPWVSGTGWLDRLRSSLAKAAAPAALGVATVGLVTGAVLLPGAPTQADAQSPAVVRSSAPETTPMASTTVSEPAPAPAPTSVPTAPAAPAPSKAAEPGVATRVLTGTGLTDACVGGSSAGAGGTGCAPEVDGGTLSVDLSPVLEHLPAPVAEQAPHLQSDWVDCTELAPLPSTQCTTPSREDS